MSTLNVDTIKNGAGTREFFPCAAWLAYNGVTNTVLDSGNVSSVTDNGTGNYTANFVVAMDNVNYSVSGSAGRTSVNAEVVLSDYGKLVGSVDLACNDNASTPVDANTVNMSIHGGLA